MLPKPELAVAGRIGSRANACREGQLLIVAEAVPQNSPEILVATDGLVPIIAPCHFRGAVVHAKTSPASHSRFKPPPEKFSSQARSPGSCADGATGSIDDIRHP
ncbi:MAG: hypothetical protein R3C12_02560 [Planctomycetaceae bacterium]